MKVSYILRNCGIAVASIVILAGTLVAGHATGNGGADSSPAAVTQTVSIRGRVMNGSAGIGLEGAVVTLVAAGLSAMTDGSGNYFLTGNINLPRQFPLTVSKDGYSMVSRGIDSHEETQNFVLTEEGKVTYVSSFRPAGRRRLLIARTLYDPATRTSAVTYLTDSPNHSDYKPNFSPDGSKITFFRAYNDSGRVPEWNSTICVMNADGSDLHELVNHEFMVTEPYWTRDGSMRVTWNQIVTPSRGTRGTYMHWSSWNGKPGEEELINPDARRDWVNPSLKDGRMLVSHYGNRKNRGSNYYLLTPNQSGKPIYEIVSYPDTPHYLHKIAISRDETMIAYQKHVDRRYDEYRGGQMVYADFDASVPAIANEVVFDELNPSTQAWYVSISVDKKYLLFAKDGKIMQHDVEAGTTTQVSDKPGEYRYPTYVTYSK
jgi:hypothetical protein